jgi:hypothetical protein
MRPEARRDDLLVEALGDELIVYDVERHRAHSLNGPAALVWRHCDGRTTIEDLALLLQRELGLPSDERLVRLALDRLGEAHLLRERPVGPADEGRLSRRQVVHQLGRASGMALVLPAVTSLAVPTVAMAQSAVPGGQRCESLGTRFPGPLQIGAPGVCVAPGDCSPAGVGNRAAEGICKGAAVANTCQRGDCGSDFPRRSCRGVLGAASVFNVGPCTNKGQQDCPAGQVFCECQVLVAAGNALVCGCECQ